MINLTNCCYPPNKSRVYKVKYAHTLKDGLPLEGSIKVRLNPGQNVESAVNHYLSQTHSIYYTNYKLIKQL